MKNLTAAGAIIAMVTGFASASFAEGGDVIVEPPTETCYDCPEEPQPKGNNGWGNGADGANPGTPKGGTADTKKNEVIWEKFDGKFDGR